MKAKAYTATHHCSPGNADTRAGSREMKMMQATNASRTFSRPGTVDRNPLTCPGCALVTPTSTQYARNARQDVTLAATWRAQPGQENTTEG